MTAVTESALPRVGVLALQGGFAAHAAALARAGFAPVEVRRAAHVTQELHGLVLPGGESTTQAMLIERFGLDGALREFVRERGRPVLATCAGLILAARYGWLDIAVERNAYGPQVASFEARDDDGRTRMVFIRAPRITRVGPRVRVIATLDGEPVMVRQGRVTGAAFHPELTDDVEIHRAALTAELTSA